MSKDSRRKSGGKTRHVSIENLSAVDNDDDVPNYVPLLRPDQMRPVPIVSVLQNRFLDAVRGEHHRSPPPAAAGNQKLAMPGTRARASSLAVPSVTITDAVDSPASPTSFGGEQYRRFSQFYLGLRRFSNSNTVEFFFSSSRSRRQRLRRQSLEVVWEFSMCVANGVEWRSTADN